MRPLFRTAKSDTEKESICILTHSLKEPMYTQCLQTKAGLEAELRGQLFLPRKMVKSWEARVHRHVYYPTEKCYVLLDLWMEQQIATCHQLLFRI